MHDGMQAPVLASGTLSEPFNVEVGVKQVCVLAPVLFSVNLMALIKLTRASLGRNAGISIQYRLDDSLFNIRRFQARTKVSSIQNSLNYNMLIAVLLLPMVLKHYKPSLMLSHPPTMPWVSK